jgi:hypothetical protein
MKLAKVNQVEEAEEEEEVKSPSNQTRKETRKGEAGPHNSSQGGTTSYRCRNIN